MRVLVDWAASSAARVGLDVVAGQAVSQSSTRQLVEEGSWAGGGLAVDGGKRFCHGLGGLGRLDHGAVGPDGRPDDQGEREGVAWTGVHLGRPLWTVHHDDRVVGAFDEAVDADLAQAAAEGLDQWRGKPAARASRPAFRPGRPVTAPS
jgi:hypothetical protein